MLLLSILQSSLGLRGLVTPTARSCRRVDKAKWVLSFLAATLAGKGVSDGVFGRHSWPVRFLDHSQW